MNHAISKHADALEQLCLRYHVQRLDLFGSATKGQRLTATGDLDFLVEFQPSAMVVYSDSYFGLLEALEQLFERPVGLSTQQSRIRFRQSVEKTAVFAA